MREKHSVIGNDTIINWRMSCRTGYVDLLKAQWRSYSNVLEALQLQQGYYTWVLNEKRDITFK